MPTVNDEVFQFSDEIAYLVRVWRYTISASLRRINNYHHNNKILLELAGGKSPLTQYVSSNWYHLVFDNNFDKLAMGSHHNVVADVCELPIKNETTSLIITISSLQYFDHDNFFSECHRVLEQGGIIALHENGSSNPIIILSRIIRRLITFYDKDTKDYCSTIRKYYRPKNLPKGFKVVFQDSDCFLTPFLFLMEKMRIPGVANLIPGIREFDAFLFRKLPFLKTYAWLNVVHLKKI